MVFGWLFGDRKRGENRAEIEALHQRALEAIRRDPCDPALRCEAVLAWMRVLAMKPGDARAADHLQTELQYPDELIAPLIAQLGAGEPAADDAAEALTQIGSRAKPALERLAQSQDHRGHRIRGLLAQME